MSETVEPLLRMRGIVKDFPGIRRSRGVDLDVRPGEVHCLLGQNGAGKSTLIKVLAGAHQPDERHDRVARARRSRCRPTRRPRWSLGIATIYQELDLVDGPHRRREHLPRPRALPRRLHASAGRAQAAARALLTRLGHPEISPGREVGDLSAAGAADRQHGPGAVPRRPADRHGRALARCSTPKRSSNLFRVIARAHRRRASPSSTSRTGSRRSAQIGDRVTVLKDGRTVATGLPAKETPTSELIRLMTGRSIEYVFPPRRPVPADAEPLLAVEGLGLAVASSHDVSFSVRAGEVVGLAGLVGAGRSEILETVFGARKSDRRHRPRRRQAAAPGLGQSRRSRRASGWRPRSARARRCCSTTAVYRNITLASLTRFARAGFLDRGAERAAAAEQVESLDVRPAGVDREARTLSGGNQQKIVLARWLLRGCRVLLLDEPTRGVDVGARSEIYALIRRLADDGRRRRRRVQRDRGGARPVRPRPRRRARAASSTRPRPTSSTSTRCSTSS